MRQCAFCPSIKLTREHIWPDWINTILPSPTIDFTTRKFDQHGASIEWRSIGLRQKAKIVCANCNNGWMSNFESQHAKPLLADMIRYGGAVSLLPRGIAEMVAFAFKMTVIANFVGLLKNDPFFSTAERYQFARTLEVPKSLQIWLFSFRTPRRIAAKFTSHLTRGIENVKPAYRFESYVGTFAIGHFGIQIAASRWVNPHTCTFGGPFPGLVEGDFWRNATVPLFPSDGTPVLWPPLRQINGDAINEFCNRWTKIRVSNDWVEKVPGSSHEIGVIPL